MATGTEKLDGAEKSSPESDVSTGNKKRSEDFRIQQLDIGDIENAVYREKWWQIWCGSCSFIRKEAPDFFTTRRPKNLPPPPRASLEDAPVTMFTEVTSCNNVQYPNRLYRSPMLQLFRNSRTHGSRNLWYAQTIIPFFLNLQHDIDPRLPKNASGPGPMENGSFPRVGTAIGETGRSVVPAST